MVDDLNFTRLDDEEFQRALANGDKRFTIPKVLRRNSGTTCNLGDLALIQNRKAME